MSSILYFEDMHGFELRELPQHLLICIWRQVASGAPPTQSLISLANRLVSLLASYLPTQPPNSLTQPPVSLLSHLPSSQPLISLFGHLSPYLASSHPSPYHPSLYLATKQPILFQSLKHDIECNYITAQYVGILCEIQALSVNNKRKYNLAFVYNQFLDSTVSGIFTDRVRNTDFFLWK